MSGIKRLSVPSLLAAAVLALSASPNLAVAQEDADEVDCESVCRVFPDRAPPECGCQVQVGALQGPGGGEYADAAVRELHEQVQESWREMTADVENYTVVQTASVVTENGPMQLGPPVVIHFEKEWIEGYPMYRFVSPAELSNREQEARGEPTAGEVGGAMSQAIGLIGGAIGGAASDAGVGGSGEAGESTGGFTLPREWSDELAELGQLMNNLDEAAEMETREDLADELLAERELWRFGEEKQSGPCKSLLLGLLWSAHYLGVTDPASPPPDAAEQLQLPWELSFDECTTVAVSGSNEAAAQAWRDLGDDGEFDGYELVEAWWVLGIFYVTHYSVHEIGMVAKLASPSGESFVVSRVDSNHAPEAPFVPQSQSAIMSGLGDAVQAVQGFVDDLYVVIHEIREILVNEGAPTREDIAQLLAEFAGEATGTGFPDS